jgi:hypothetical protein
VVPTDKYEDYKSRAFIVTTGIHTNPIFMEMAWTMHGTEVTEIGDQVQKEGHIFLNPRDAC